MSIRPVDYINVISKSQEIAKVRQVENDKFRVQSEQGFVQQEKQIEQNIKKVRDTSKSENQIIDVDKRGGSGNSRERKKEREKKKKVETEDNPDLGGNIDIKI